MTPPKNESGEGAALATVTFLVVPTNDEMITCVGCGVSKCTHEFVLRRGVSTYWCGIHEKCIEAFQRSNSDVTVTHHSLRKDGGR